MIKNSLKETFKTFAKLLEKLKKHNYQFYIELPSDAFPNYSYKCFILFIEGNISVKIETEEHTYFLMSYANEWKYTYQDVPLDIVISFIDNINNIIKLIKMG